MSNLIEHARRELFLAGLFDKDSDYGGLLGDAILSLVERFSEQGHSGFSASMAISIFSKVANFEPLIPLTGEDDEWNKIDENMWQNNRCSSVFKDKDHAWDIEGIIFREANGCCYTSSDSHVTITFPYTPKREYVDVGKQ